MTEVTQILEKATASLFDHDPEMVLVARLAYQEVKTLIEGVANRQ